MASQVAREWPGFQNFSDSTQAKLDLLFENLKQENVSTLTILVMGKSGVGKSSTVNSIFGERVASVSAFQSEGPSPLMFSRSRGGFTLNVIDTPGLVEGGYVNEHAINTIKRFLLNKTIDVFIYVDRFDVYRQDNLDRQVIKAITDSFGNGIWRRGLVVLTHAQFTPPADAYYAFSAKRSEAILKFIRLGAYIKTREFQDYGISVVLVENSSRCKMDGLGERILPDGTAWFPHLMRVITDVAMNHSKAITVKQKFIDGPNPNAKWKLFIPLILAFQYFCVADFKSSKHLVVLLLLQLIVLCIGLLLCRLYNRPGRSWREFVLTVSGNN
ncbi:hypothetical protein J5N97_006783 [Dioscorea zingiberensis]|uniref:AIG1-type G domain-containing protein n=1 Tax=Dioscorea zingiberensis TaxID=325984 RepID=A0A9D5HUC1_9LILI|nr:hypothetical protein J5N97_006783 [Dioscorea zingiberensis]